MQYMLEQGAMSIATIQDIAAAKIQAVFRGYCERRNFRERRRLLVRHEILRKDVARKKAMKEELLMMASMGEDGENPPPKRSGLCMDQTTVMKNFGDARGKSHEQNVTTECDIAVNSKWKKSCKEDLIKRNVELGVPESTPFTSSSPNIYLHPDNGQTQKSQKSACSIHQTIGDADAENTNVKTFTEEGIECAMLSGRLKCRIQAATVIQRAWKRYKYSHSLLYGGLNMMGKKVSCCRAVECLISTECQLGAKTRETKTFEERKSAAYWQTQRKMLESKTSQSFPGATKETMSQLCKTEHKLPRHKGDGGHVMKRVHLMRKAYARHSPLATSCLCGTRQTSLSSTFLGESTRLIVHEAVKQKDPCRKESVQSAVLIPTEMATLMENPTASTFLHVKCDDTPTRL
uniref:uncharacterized protein isoform X2 n=1 Tax=Myxine glutinosa TaxID=7769 RepID=UPI00358F26ED